MLGPIVLLLSVALTLASGLVGLVAWRTGRRGLAAQAAAVAGGVIVVYAAALFSVSAMSVPGDLQIGDRKCFGTWCARVTRVAPNPSVPGFRARGAAFAVDVTVVNTAEAVAVRPSRPRAFVEDADGAEYDPVAAGGAAADLSRRLQPGESYQVTLVFDVPSNTRHPRFVITEGGFPTQFLINDENSPFHAHRGWPLT